MRGEREGEEMIERGESYERERELLLLLLLLLSCLSFFRLLRVSRKRSQVFAQRLHSRGLAWECDLWLKTLDSSNDFEPSNENLQKCMVCEFHSTNSFKNH